MQKNITLAAVKRAQKVIVLNDDMIALLKNFKDKLVKLPCGTDVEYFHEIPVEKKPQTYLIGFPGNKARKEKNHPLFIEITDQLRSEFNIEIVEFHNLTRDEVVTNLNKIDLLLMTSLVEGSPQIIKEAMACNRAIISTSVGDVDYLLSGVTNSRVIKSFNAEDFIEPVKEILRLPQAERRSNGRDQLHAIGLDADSVANSINKIYNELV
ncbi:MAG: glycosyltransferase [Sphingobacteriaceae bacterium]|nr:MAG: glycosyltransferase [Sphingobacteriaceae bacterium]